jgi:DNA-binding FadR family transcriptional regulator
MAISSQNQGAPFLSNGADAAIFRPVTAANVFEETVQRLAHAIKIGAVRPGERFPSERELAPRLGVSRVTLREAIRALEQAGYVQSRRGRHGGTFVTSRRRKPPSVAAARRLAREMGDQLIDILDFRAVIEPGAAEMAAEHAGQRSGEQLARLAAAAARAPIHEYRVADVRLHLAIAELTGSQSLTAAVADVQMRLTDLLGAMPRPERAIEQGNRHHDSIVAAIQARDGATARQAMREHVDATAAVLRGFLD